MEPIWYIRKDESADETGPFEKRSLLEALKDGHIRRLTQVRREGSEQWSAIQDHPDFVAAPAHAAAVTAAVSLAPDAPAASTSPSFSWARGFKHFAVVAAIIIVAGVLVGAMIRVEDSRRFASELGRVVGKSVLAVLLVSYLVQTGRRAWAIGVVLVLFVLPLLFGFFMSYSAR